MNEKIRLDILMTEKGLAPSREKAKAFIMEGRVFVNEEKVDKAGALVRPDSAITVRGDAMRYVSRGGYKLEKAIEKYGLRFDESVCMDIGASTGGFTDCMLQNGASRVYAIDVGYGQLAWSLRTDPRVVNLERTNVRYLTTDQVPEKVDFASVDVSFISLSLIFPVLKSFLKDGGSAVALVKPQFEAGKGKVGKKGVVRDPQIHLEVLLKVIDISKANALYLSDIDYSPIKGPEGNIEYLFYLQNSDEPTVIGEEEARRLVENSHTALD